jgi:hypothetical protein
MLTGETHRSPLSDSSADGLPMQRYGSTQRDDPDELLSASEAARRLGITRTTLYDWLGRSKYGLLEIRGQSVTIDALQGGAKGQGRIRIEAREVQRLRELMRVTPLVFIGRKPIVKRQSFPGINVPLGRPHGSWWSQYPSDVLSVGSLTVSVAETTSFVWTGRSTA